MQIKSNKLDAVFIKVKELNYIMRPFIFNFHGTIRSMSTYYHGAMLI